VSSGSCVAVRYAATHHERVRRLVLHGGYGDGRDLASEAARDSLTRLVASHWGLGSRVLADLFLPGAGPDERDGFARYQRLSASSQAAAASLASVYAMDVRADLPTLTAPTEVLHRRDDRTIPATLGRDVAARIPGATFVPLDGFDHLPWRGDGAAVVRAVSRFLVEPDQAASAPTASSPVTSPPSRSARWRCFGS
jgi:pimeloyl-ACP methyl ester carboxylesterase